jgi:hypothetical protein
MLRMAINHEKPGVSVQRRNGEVLIQIGKRKCGRHDFDVVRLDIVSGRRHGADMMLAQRNRHHDLLVDNPSGD